MNALIHRHLVDDPSWKLHWQMASGDRVAFSRAISVRKPSLALEIGTYQGGSLQVISQYAGHVISVDIDPEVPGRLAGIFPNVEFVTGDSDLVLPSLIEKLNRERRGVGFVLIDGDHTHDGVRRDVEHVLQLNVTEPLALLIHDSFNPAVRSGILDVDWPSYPHVHEFEVDFSGGVFFEKAFDTAPARTMWGGLACALLLPAKRERALPFSQSQSFAFGLLYAESAHAPRSLWKRIKAKAGDCLQ
jgi:hypothetical protein